MIFRTIRSRLALSFAGIALVAAVALGAVLLAILQNYYSNLELDYLRENAKVIGDMVTTMSSEHAPPDDLQSQVENMAFLTQTRIQVYNPGGYLLFDSGSPQKIGINIGVMKQVHVERNGVPPNDALPIISIAGESKPAFSSAGGTTSVVPAPGDKVLIYRSVRVGGSPFGFYLNDQTIQTNARSNLAVELSVHDPKSTQLLGSVRLSEGPAYGRDVLRSVAAGWLIASIIAVLLAAAVGWYISRRISAPVLALTDVTARMAQGDLSSRANVQNRDELGQLARSFNEMADQVETTVTTLRRFVSDAAHELRTPLTALRTNLDLALDEKNAQDRLVFVARAQAMVERLEELNANLLDLSRLEANGHAGGDVVVDWVDLLRQRLEAYASQAEQAELLFESELPPMSLLIRADASQLTRAMDNLLDNACKFTPQGGSVRVVLARKNEKAVFTVTDTGIGIPADDLSQVFSRFHRGRNTNAYPGSGLGLAIVKAIATVHKGQVEAHSDGEGKGSQFSIALPVVPIENT